MALIGSITSPAISGNTNIDSGTLFVDSVGNSVGFGTTTPNKGPVGGTAVTLNSAAGVGNIVEFCQNNSRTGWLYNDNNQTALAAGGARYIGLETNGSVRTIIDSSGVYTFQLRGGMNVNPYLTSFTYSDCTVSGQSFEIPIHTIIGRDLRMTSVIVQGGGTNYKSGGNAHFGFVAHIAVGYGGYSAVIDSHGTTITARASAPGSGYQQIWITIAGSSGTDTGSQISGIIFGGAGQY